MLVMLWTWKSLFTHTPCRLHPQTVLNKTKVGGKEGMRGCVSGRGPWDAWRWVEKGTSSKDEWPAPPYPAARPCPLRGPCWPTCPFHFPSQTRLPPLFLHPICSSSLEHSRAFSQHTGILSRSSQRQLSRCSFLANTIPFFFPLILKVLQRQPSHQHPEG